LTDEWLQNLERRLARLESASQEQDKARERDRQGLSAELGTIWKSLHALSEIKREVEDRFQESERTQDETMDRLEALEGSLEPLWSELDKLRESCRDLRAGREAQEEDLRGLERALASLQATRDEPLAGLAESVESLRREVRGLRRELDSPLVAHLEEVVPVPASTDPQEEELPELVLPSRDALLQIEGSLTELARTLPPEPAGRIASELEDLRTLLQTLDQEEHFRRRAGEILRLLEARLVERGPEAAVRVRVRDFLFLRMPDLEEDLQDLARREELEPEALRLFEQALEDLLDEAGLEEVRPRRGDLMQAACHSLLRVERVGEPGLQGRVAFCLRPGLRVRATGEILRKAEVSVFP
jgi:chromosome segregation ATPase